MINPLLKSSTQFSGILLRLFLSKTTFLAFPIQIIARILHKNNEYSPKNNSLSAANSMKLSFSHCSKQYSPIFDTIEGMMHCLMPELKKR